MAEPYYERNDLTRDVLRQDPQFDEDSYLYMLERTGRSIPDIDERIDEFAELMRQGQVNEVTAIKNLTHIRSLVDDEDKARMGRMFLAYDKVDGLTSFWKKIGDYTTGVITSPATIAAIPTAGASLLAKTGMSAATATLGVAIRRLASESIRTSVRKGALGGAAKAAGMEATSGAIIEGTTAEAKKETGLEQYQQEDWIESAALGGGMGAVGGAVLGGAVGAVARPRAARAARIFEKGASAKQARIDKGTETGKLYLSSLSPKEREESLKFVDATIEKISLRALDPEGVLKGKKAKSQVLPWITRLGEGKPRAGTEGVVRAGDEVIPEPFTAGLRPEVMRNISMAALEIIKKTGRPLPEDVKELRITQILHDVLTGEQAAGKLLPEELEGIIRSYGLTPQEFSHLYLAEVSEAARILATQSQMSKLFSKSAAETLHNNLKVMQEQSQKLVSEGRLAGDITPVPEEVLQMTRAFSLPTGLSPANYYTILKNIDKARLGLMTIQPATTIRNTANGTARMAIFALDNFFQGAVMQLGTKESRIAGKHRMFAGPRLLKTMLDPSEASILKAMFSEEMPVNFRELFRKAADIEAAMGTGKSFVKVSRWLNGLNTLADNTFKRAVFMSELQSLVGRKQLLKHMEEGTFNEIDPKFISEAMTEALSFTYQKGYNKRTGDSVWEAIGDGFIKTFNKPGMSLIIPFPRFTANSLEFMYKHAPLVGLMDFPKLLGRATKAIGPELEGAALKKALARKERARKAVPKRVAQQITGLGMLYGAIQLRAQQGPDARWWELYNKDTGEYENAQAFYGPFAAYMWMADLITRSSMRDMKIAGAPMLIGDELKNNWQDTAKDPIYSKMLEYQTFTEFLKAAFGPQFKTGIGNQLLGDIQDTIADNIIISKGVTVDSIEDAQQREIASRQLNTALMEMAGNVASTFLVSMGAVRDVMATFDPKEYEGIKATDNVSPMDAFIKTTLRALPITSDGKYFRIISSAEILGLEESTAGDIIIPTALPSEPSAKRKKGLERQLIGIGSPKYKNIFQKELDRLGLQAWKLFPNVPDDDSLTRIVKKHYQEIVQRDIIPFISEDVYKELPPEQRKYALRNFVTSKRDTVYDIASQKLEEQFYDTQDPKKQARIEKQMARLLQTKFRAMPDVERSMAISSFKSSFGRSPDLNDVNEIRGLIAEAKRFRKRSRSQ